MALTVQDDTGTVVGANAYVDAAFVVAYFADRGTDLSATPTADLEAAIVRATQFLDTRYNFIGTRRNIGQTTQWPRIDAWDRDQYLITGLPTAVKSATAELAQRSLTVGLLPDPDRDTSGRAPASKSEKVGPISETTVYAAGGSYKFPEYPAVDRLLQAEGLVRLGRVAVRA